MQAPPDPDAIALADLTVLVPSHRRTDLLEACLSSLFATARPSVLVVDDGSADGCVTRTASRFPDVATLRLEKSVGFCGAVNAGLRQVATPFVQLLNDDAEVTPGWFEAPLRRLRDATAGAVTPLVLQWPGGRIDSAGDCYDFGGFARKRGHGERPEGEYLQACPVPSASGCGAFYRLAALREVGGFPEHFIAYFDDVDVSCRLRRAGYSIWCEPASRLLHHGSASYGKRPAPRVLAMQSRNEERLFWRNRRRRQVADLARHGAVLVGKGWRRLEEGTLRPFLDGRLRAWAELLPWKGANA